MKQLKQPPISEEEAKELAEFVEDVISIDYETFEKCKSDFPWYWGKIMKFFRLPKTPLHEKYMQWCRPSRELKEKNETWIILRKMDTNSQRMMDEYNLMESEVRYQIIKRIKTWHKFWWNDEVITIWIPYFDNTEKRARYYWTINIYQSKTPALFEEVANTYRRFTWEPEIMIR